MIEEAYDLVIRVNPEPDESLVGRVFLHDRLVVVASPVPTPAADGSAVPAVVRGPVRQSDVWNVTTPTGKSRIAVNPILSLSSLVMVCDAVRMGVGAGRLPASLVSHDLAAGTLVHWGTARERQIAPSTRREARVTGSYGVLAQK